MKSKAFLLLSFFPLFLVQACGGGSIVLKSSDGSKISFKKENVFCERQDSFVNDIICTANGVRTDLTNRKYPFSEKEVCSQDKKFIEGILQKLEKPIIHDYIIACSAAKQFGLIGQKNADYHYSLIKSKLHLKDYEGALSDLTRAMDIFPNDANFYDYRAGVKYNLSDFRGVISDLNMALKKNRNNDSVFVMGELISGQRHNNSYRC